LTVKEERIKDLETISNETRCLQDQLESKEQRIMDLENTSKEAERLRGHLEAKEQELEKLWWLVRATVDRTLPEANISELKKEAAAESEAGVKARESEAKPKEKDKEGARTSFLSGFRRKK
jgi:peptidoglycan hydrolase CwlO-like protein